MPYVQVLKDFGVFLVKSYAEVSGIDDVKLFHESAMILIALLASLPFWIRVRQCWVQFEGAAGTPTYIRTYILGYLFSILAFIVHCFLKRWDSTNSDRAEYAQVYDCLPAHMDHRLGHPCIDCS